VPFHVYILSNRTQVLYVGVTSDLRARVSQHKSHAVPGFTRLYNVDRLVYFEEFGEAMSAIEREKRLKRMTRAKKIALIERANPLWRDLADEF
jgi:putative endonuclease